MVAVPEWWPRPITAPANEAERDAVRVAQRALRLNPTGNLDEPTRASLRGTQRMFKLPVTGDLDLETALVIDDLRPWQLQEEDT